MILFIIAAMTIQLFLYFACFHSLGKQLKKHYPSFLEENNIYDPSGVGSQFGLLKFLLFGKKLPPEFVEKNRPRLLLLRLSYALGGILFVLFGFVFYNSSGF